MLRRPGSSSGPGIGTAVSAVAAPLVWHNLVLPRLGLGPRGRTAAGLAFAAGYSIRFRSVRARGWWTRDSPRWVAGAVLVPVAGAVLAYQLPAVRRELVRRAGPRRPPAEFAEWLLVRIPLGTVFVEEQIFRAVLPAVLAATVGPRSAGSLAAATFGLWHVHPARSAGDSVPGTVALTAIAGLGFDILAGRGGVVAAAAAHGAIDGAGAVLVQLAGSPG